MQEIQRMRTRPIELALLVWLLLASALRAENPDLVFADFEGADYGDWKATGQAFGKGPAAGTLPDQMPVTGFKGRRLVNSYHGGDGTTGTLTSPPFTVSRKYITFLIGGGGHAGKTCMNLLVKGKVVQSASGPAEGSEHLEEASWDVRAWMGQTATLEIVDAESGGWGHVLVDQIVFTDHRPSSPTSARREIVAGELYLLLPVKNGARMRRVSVSAGGAAVRSFTIELADGEPDWWAFLDIRAWKGKTLTIEVDRVPSGSKGLSLIHQGASLKGARDLYRETLRPQLHFSSRRGWLNDPNGLVFYEGEYHLFYQHNPYGTRWGNMHWGHAVSRDLVRWQESPIALYPDEMGPMFSGSAVVDWKNTSGLGKDGRPPLVLVYTAFGPPAVQCLAFSNDGGRSWSKYDRNPILKTVAPENRDPKVIWHEPTKSWVMVLYVGMPAKSGKGIVHTIQFFTSSDLKHWTYRSQVEGLFECPDLFPLSLDGEAKNAKWVLTAASSEYLVGSFDGVTFHPETPKLPGQRGRGFYAAQTFSDIPAADGRRIQIGWGQMPSPGMPFNQMMCFPCELSLRSTSNGPRLAWRPVREIEKLYKTSHRLGSVTLKPGAANPLDKIKAELLELRLEIEAGEGAECVLTVRGTKIRYDAARKQLHLADHTIPTASPSGKFRLTVLVDRTSLTLWADDGLTYAPFPVLAKPDDLSVNLSVAKGTANVASLEVHELRSIWLRDSP
jgi:sucrose-6-phosphate hydrolase SacC (GH32 family)